MCFASFLEVGEVIPPADGAPHRWAVTLADTLHEDDEPVVSQEPVKRALKEHPSFEAWIAGSPHDSDEYDTDIDIEDYVKSMEFFNTSSEVRKLVFGILDQVQYKPASTLIEES